MPGSDLTTTAEKLSALRTALNTQRLHGVIVPKADAFQNESVPASDDRLAWLTGFTGSAGIAIITQEKATLFVDSRYSLQAKAQVSETDYAVELYDSAATVTDWLSVNAPAGSVIGFDANLHTLTGFKPLRETAERCGFELRAATNNIVDGIWTDRPAAARFPLVIHDEAFAGESAADKIKRVQAQIADRKADGLLVAAPDAVAWLFNVRGHDVRHTPSALMRAFVPISGKPTLFASAEHITTQNRAVIEALANIQSIETLPGALSSLIGTGKIMADPASTTVAFAEIVKAAGATLIEAPDPCAKFKAIKNAVELQGSRNAHHRDAVALCRFHCWLDKHGQAGVIDELGAAEKLEALRRETGELQDLSFDTISGAGSNGAIVHYRSTPETNRVLHPGTLFLVDSGAQYRDGTTDVTRTVAIGTPTADMRRHFTLVLKGHIAIATARFPAKTRGVDLDPFARRALWDAGLDYGHGTGHGVGSYLSVHEGPQGISRNSMVALEPGMIVSNEPGYYREGHYGIRIENLMAVIPAAPIDGGEVPMLGFETLTLAPIDRQLIDVNLLSANEIAWLDAYHRRVMADVSPMLDSETRSWLAQTTAPLACGIVVP